MKKALSGGVKHRYSVTVSFLTKSDILALQVS